MPETLKFSERYRTVAEANRRVYDKNAHRYNENVACITESDDQAALLTLIQRAIDAAQPLRPGRAVRALDACGGSGNAALKLQAEGCEVTLADISKEMVARYEKACAEQGYPVRTAVGEIGGYFSSGAGPFDLIVFSSALHHLEDPVLVLRLAQRVLGPGGIIATIFDPVRRPVAYRAVREPFRMIRRAVTRPELIAHRAVPVLKRIVAGGNAYKRRRRLEITDDNLGNLAEFHGGVGFDDRALGARIERETELRVIRHDRFHAGVQWMDCLAWRLFGIGNRFSLLLRYEPKGR